jgi:succinate dehydrogenase and fumarate reductase iron-sulfur protein
VNTVAANKKSYGEARRLGQAEHHDGLGARNALLRDGDTLTVTIKRSGSAEGGSGHAEQHKVPYQKRMRVLDVLNHISEHSAPDLAYRWFCGSKMCGGCAVRMNGREVLACWEAALPDMVIEPLRNLPVIRDLVVDRTPYEKRVADFEPWLERHSPYESFPEPLSHVEMKNASKALDCISCMACYSACPVVGLGDLTNFAGPAPLVQLGQTALDPRNDPDKVRRSLERSGIFNCVSCYKCEEVCPAGIPIVSRVIEPLKAKAAELSPTMARHSRVFRDIVMARGRIDPGELILRVQGWRVLMRIPRLLRMLVRGKIKPVRTLLGLRTAAAGAAKRILNRKST